MMCCFLARCVLFGIVCLQSTSYFERMWAQLCNGTQLVKTLLFLMVVVWIRHVHIVHSEGWLMDIILLPECAMSRKRVSDFRTVHVFCGCCNV